MKNGILNELISTMRNQEIYKNVVFKTFLYMEYIWSLKRYN